MKNVTVRAIKEEDYEFINEWWKDTSFNPPPRELLPENGLHGLMICKNKKPIACTYIYLTNSKMAYSDYLISNPDYKSRDRFEIITKLMAASVETAYSLGVLDFWFITNNKNMIKRCKELNVHVSDDTYNLILPLRYNKKDNVGQRGFSAKLKTI
jgi:hypothetical protein